MTMVPWVTVDTGCCGRYVVSLPTWLPYDAVTLWLVLAVGRVGLLAHAPLLLFSVMCGRCVGLFGLAPGVVRLAHLRWWLVHSFRTAAVAQPFNDLTLTSG